MTIKRKILLVTNGFYPEISPRSYRSTELAKEFCRQGHEVTVISKFRDHDYAKFLLEYPINLKMWESSRFTEIPESKKDGRAVAPAAAPPAPPPPPPPSHNKPGQRR